MKKNIADKWVAALRSGKYKQTKHSLKDEHGYCCLGVLCEIRNTMPTKKELNDAGDLLSKRAQLDSGVSSQEGYMNSLAIELSSLNDGYTDIYSSPHVETLTFDEIADIIQINWKEL